MQLTRTGKKNILPLESVDGVRGFVDFACRADDGSVVLLGWLFDPQHKVGGFALLVDESSPEKSSAPRPLEHVTHFPRPDVAAAMAAPPESELGFVLVCPTLPSGGKPVLALGSGQHALLPFSAVEGAAQIKSELDKYWHHSGQGLLATLRAALGDQHPLTRIAVELDELHDRNGSEIKFQVECVVRQAQGLILVGWLVNDRREFAEITLYGDRGWKKSVRVVPGREWIRTFRPDLKDSLSPREYERGLLGFVMYLPGLADAPATLSLTFEGALATQKEIVVLPAGNRALADLQAVWVHSGIALQALATDLNDATLAALFDDVELTKTSSAGQSLLACDHALLLNGSGLILNGWIGKPQHSLHKVELVTDEVRLDITQQIRRYERPDLYTGFPWSVGECLGFVCCLERPEVLGGDIRLRVVCREGEGQVLRPEVAVVDWAMLGSILQQNQVLAAPLLATLAQTDHQEESPARLGQRLALLERGVFKARHPHLPRIVDHPETVIAAVDRGYALGAAGLLIFGWQLAPKRKPAAIRIRGDKGENVEISGHLTPVARNDVLQKYRSRFAHLNDWCGFVALVPLPTRTGETRALCFDFAEMGEEWLKIPSTDTEIGRRFFVELLELLPAALYREQLLRIGKVLGQERLMEICIAEYEDERLAQGGASPLVVCEQALVLNARTLLLHGWFGVPDAELMHVEVLTDGASIDITATLRRIMRPDLGDRIGWAADEPAGFLACLEDPRLIGEELKLRITNRKGARQLIRLNLQQVDWFGLCDFARNHLGLQRPLLDLLALGKGAEEDAARWNERLSWLQRTLFKARHSQLPTMLDHSETVLAAIDRSYALGEDGLLVFGWLLTPKQPPASVTIWSADGACVDVTERLFPLLRSDVVQNFRQRFPRIEEGCGFVCLAPLATDPGEERALRFDFGSLGEYWLKVPVERNDKSAVDLTREILSMIPAPERMRHSLHSLFSSGLGQAIEAVNHSRPRSERKIEERQFGLPAAAPLVSVVVPLYGRFDFLRYQLAQFVDDPDFQTVDLVYVVDDPNILAPTLELAAKYAPLFKLPFRLVWNGENRGFAGANNIGAKVARGKYLLLLNSDVIPQQSGWISILREALETLPGAGLVGPLLEFGDGSIQHAGMYPRREPLLPGFLLNTHRRMGMVWQDGDEPLQPPLLTAACMLLRKADYLAVGGFDEGYVIGDFEDSDLCLALRKLGKQLWLVPAARLWHLERQSQGGAVLGQRQLLTLYNGWRYGEKIRTGALADPTMGEG